MTPAQRKAAVLTLASALAVPAEGLRRTYYYDPPGILTVCYGHTGKVDKSKTYSLTECRALLDKDMNHAIETVDKCAPGLPPAALAAFADAAYNLGPTVACDTSRSTAARLLKAGRIRDACEQLPRWDKAKLAGVLVALPGLTKRRAAERDLCLSGV
jgi:GH24 family phage-related lysozyme (muramidase)